MDIPPPFPPPQPGARPPLSEYEASFHTMQAASAARAEAAQMGGDPAQIGALLRAAQPVPAPGFTIGGVSLHPINLAVTVAIAEITRLTENNANAALTVARLAYCFHAPRDAFLLLTQGKLSELDAKALSLTEHWQEGHILAFSNYVQACKANNPSTQAPAPVLPGKSPMNPAMP